VAVANLSAHTSEHDCSEYNESMSCDRCTDRQQSSPSGRHISCIHDKVVSLWNPGSHVHKHDIT